MRLTFYLTVLSALFLIIGCGQKEVEVDTSARFCDVEEPRRFSQEELDWRAANAAWNLRRDFKTNASWDRECAPSPEGTSSEESVSSGS